jgi:hypothetical protein
LDEHSSDDNLMGAPAAGEDTRKPKKGRKSFADKKKFEKFNTFRTIDERFESLFGSEIRTESSKPAKKWRKISSESSDDDFEVDEFDVDDFEVDVDGDAAVESKPAVLAQASDAKKPPAVKKPPAIKKPPDVKKSPPIKKSPAVKKTPAAKKSSAKTKMEPSQFSETIKEESDVTPVGDFASYVTRTLLKSIDASPSASPKQSKSDVKEKKKFKFPEVVDTESGKKTKTEKKFPEVVETESGKKAKTEKKFKLPEGVKKEAGFKTSKTEESTKMTVDRHVDEDAPLRDQSYETPFRPENF